MTESSSRPNLALAYSGETYTASKEARKGPVFTTSSAGRLAREPDRVVASEEGFEWAWLGEMKALGEVDAVASEQAE